MKIAIKRVDESLMFSEFDGVYRSDAAQCFLDKYTDRRAIWLDADRCLAFICDAAGLCRNLPLNFFLEVPTSPWPVQAIVGDVIFVRTKPVNIWEQEIYDYEVEDITEADIQYITKLLSWETQRRLFTEYRNGR